MYFCTLEIKLWFSIMLCIVSSESISILEEKLIFASVIFPDWLILICILSESRSSFPDFRRVGLTRHAHQVFFFGGDLYWIIHRTTKSCSGGKRKLDTKESRIQIKLRRCQRSKEPWAPVLKRTTDTQSSGLSGVSVEFNGLSIQVSKTYSWLSIESYFSLSYCLKSHE